MIIKFETSQLIKHLKGPWLENVTYILRMCLGDLGKGWFNINQKQYEYYEIAKLLRMMELVKHIMQVSLRGRTTSFASFFINARRFIDVALPRGNLFTAFSFRDVYPYVSFGLKLYCDIAGGKPLYLIKLKAELKNCIYPRRTRHFAIRKGKQIERLQYLIINSFN